MAELSSAETLRAAAAGLRNEVLVELDPHSLQEFADGVAEVFERIAWAVNLDEHLIGRVGYEEALRPARVLLGVPDGR